MSLEFVIIPTTNKYENAARDVKDVLEDSINQIGDVTVDCNYLSPLNTRVSKWKKNEYIIITVDNEYFLTNSITVRFADKKSHPSLMEVDEFISLVSSFNDAGKDDDSDDAGKNVVNNDKNVVNNDKDVANNDKDVAKNNDTDDDTDNNGCIIM